MTLYLAKSITIWSADCDRIEFPGTIGCTVGYLDKKIMYGFGNAFFSIPAQCPIGRNGHAGERAFDRPGSQNQVGVFSLFSATSKSSQSFKIATPKEIEKELDWYFQRDPKVEWSCHWSKLKWYKRFGFSLGRFFRIIHRVNRSSLFWTNSTRLNQILSPPLLIRKQPELSHPCPQHPTQGNNRAPAFQPKEFFERGQSKIYLYRRARNVRRLAGRDRRPGDVLRQYLSLRHLPQQFFQG